MALDLEELLAPLGGLDDETNVVAQRLLRSSLDFPPDRYLVMAVGQLGDGTTAQGPFMGRTLEEARAEALTATQRLAGVRLVGPARVDDLRRILFGKPIEEPEGLD
jgi:hypothetical protein